VNQIGSDARRWESKKGRLHLQPAHGSRKNVTPQPSGLGRAIDRDLDPHPERAFAVLGIVVLYPS
jgi:hypothetical protein